MRELHELPSSPESERAMLGSIMLNNLLIEEAKRDCPVDWLYVPSHRMVLTAMLALNARREEINGVLVGEELRKDNAFESCGGAVFLANLMHGVPPAANLKNYIKLIREAHRRRWALKFAEMIEAQAIDGEMTPDEMFAQAISKLDTVRGLGTEKRQPSTLEDIADDQMYRYERFFQGISDALPTGFPEIDENLMGGGLSPSGLYILAASTSLGKTTLGLDIAANIGGSGHRTYVVSREMSRESLFDRLVAFQGGIHRWKLRPGIWESDYKRAQRAVIQLAEKPIVLDDTSLTVGDVRGYLRESANRGNPVEFLMIDYLQLLESEGKRRETRNQEVGSVSRALKGLAMEFQIPVIALSQLSRNSAKERREPELMDLRDSGEIEQDADAVFFLFGEKPEEGAKYFDRTLKCSKQREGPLFRVELPFNGELVTYRRRPLEEVA
jgi:replicative DNA helicase